MFIGPHLPGLLFHEGFDLARLARVEWTGLTGVFGTIMNVMVTIVFIFIVLAAFLRVSGAGAYFIDLALSLTGRMKGGPALSSVVASTFFGMVSGSPVANVLGTGTFTIPLMKKSGFNRRIAAAVEAASSSGGYLVPPIMGASAFIMAELTGILTYIHIALVAIIPSTIYYVSLFVGVYLYADKVGAKGIPAEQLPKTRDILKKGSHVFLAFPILIGALVVGYTPAKSAFFTLICLMLLSAIRKDTRMDVKKTIRALKDGADKSLGILTACASMGIIIGVMDLTGLGINLGFAIELLTAGNLFACLLLIMLASVILGMGVAPVATYILLVVMLGPVLELLGLPLIVAHFFIMYFSTKATITPPVALAAYAGAGIAGSKPFQTGVEAFKLGLPGFLAPFLFAYYPALLLTESVWKAIMLLIFALIITVPLNIANFGYFLGRVKIYDRIMVVVAALLIGLQVISTYLFIFGLAIMTYVIVKQYIGYRVRERISAENAVTC